ncbi:katanin-like protein, putative [Bodo saltans]|uniref:Katanin-like protein, putative n=1 Tax=Bodo saltans TaxID=75058 RepID=A0A0S4JUG1_BODSA|nr:katanin-like protein, putative [Bodo saltans]|eukprot:CUG94047.1 katanin-like protein, putative [Bodo saltans]
MLSYRQFDAMASSPSPSSQNISGVMNSGVLAGNRLLCLMHNSNDWANTEWCDLTRTILNTNAAVLHDRMSGSAAPVVPSVDDLQKLLQRTRSSLEASPVTSWICNLPLPSEPPLPTTSHHQQVVSQKRPREDDAPPQAIRPSHPFSIIGKEASKPHALPQPTTQRIVPLTVVPEQPFVAPPPVPQAATTFRLPLPHQAPPVAAAAAKIPFPPPAVAHTAGTSPTSGASNPTGAFGAPRMLGLRGIQQDTAKNNTNPTSFSAQLPPSGQASFRNPQPASEKDDAPPSGFVTAAQQLDADIKRGRCPPGIAASLQTKPSLGLRRQPYSAPLHNNNNNSGNESQSAPAAGSVGVGRVLSSTVNPKQQQSKSNGGEGGGSEHDPADYPAQLLLPDGSVPPILLPLDPKLVTQITYEILEKQCNVDWSDIAGLDFAKSSVEEAIVWPLRRPDLFVGLRDPPRGLLLFGPPGTGKTMIARAIASRAECTFLNISSSSLMSKWVGDGEKMVRCMFAVAVLLQPSVIFIDEIDSLLSMRSEGEQDGVRRVKTEFLVQLDGVGTSASDRVLLIGATNRPEELDEAARRRMEKRLYIPLPEEQARSDLCRTLLSKGNFVHHRVIFIDEIDSLLSMRSEGEQDGVRRVKTEFLVQLDGVGTSASDRVLLIGATNRPEELDEAARRRMEKRLYIPLPEEQARSDLCRTLLSKGNFVHSIGDAELLEIAQLTEGYSGADLKSLCREAAMGPLRSTKTSLLDVNAADIRPVMLKDFKGACRRIKPSVGQSELERYVKWNNQFGSFVEHEEDDDEE